MLSCLSYSCKVGEERFIFSSTYSWILGAKLSLGLGVNEFQETGYPELGPVRTSLFNFKPTMSRDFSS